MKAILTHFFLLLSTLTVFAGDTTGTWVGTMQHKGTGVNTSVWYVKMNLTTEGGRCFGTITYDFMKRNSPLTLEVKFKGELLENTLVINYYSKDIKKSGPDARNLLLQYRYNLLLVKNKFTNEIYGDYVGLSKGLIADQTKGYLFLEPEGLEKETVAKKMDLRIDSLIAVKDNPPPPPQPEIITKPLPALAEEEKKVAKKTEQPKADIKNATVKALPDIKPPVTAPAEEKKDTQVITKTPPVIKKETAPPVKTEPVIIKKDTQVVVKNEPLIKKDTSAANVPAKQPKIDAAVTTAKAEAQTKLKARENVVSDRLLLDTGEVVVDFYDNGAIDGDIITVIHNKAITLSSAALTDKPLRFSFHIDEQNPLHEIVMYAENQGTVPPNTALMIITYGSQRKQVFLSADDKKSAVVLLELKK